MYMYFVIIISSMQGIAKIMRRILLQNGYVSTMCRYIFLQNGHIITIFFCIHFQSNKVFECARQCAMYLSFYLVILASWYLWIVCLNSSTIVPRF